MGTSCRIDPKLVQNPSKIDKNRSLGRFGTFSAPFRAQVGSRTLPGIRRTHLFDAFCQKMTLQGAIFGLPPPWIQNGSKIELLSIDRRLDPPKMTSGRGFRKIMKIRWKIDAKSDAFWRLKTTFGVILFAYFTLSPFLEKIEKIDAKRAPKIHENWSQNRLLADLWPSLSTFWLFWAMPKNDEILKPLWKVNKS